MRPRPGDARIRWAVPAILIALGLGVAEAMRSHAAAATPSGLAIGAMTLHLLAASCWLGGLAALVVILSPQPQPGARTALLRACGWPFTLLAAGSGLVVTVTGLYAAGRQVEFLAGLTGSRYGLTLLAKVGLVALICGLGLTNSVRLHRPGRRGPARSIPSFHPVSRRPVLVEVAVGAAVLLAAALLLQTAPARGDPTAGPAPAEARSRHGRLGATIRDDLAISVSAAPNLPGSNGFTVLAASARRPPPAPVTGVSLLVEQGDRQRTVDLHRVGPDVYFGTGRLERVGEAATIVVRIRRAGHDLRAPMAWTVDAPVPAAATPPGRRLTPWTDGGALLLLLAGLVAALGTAWVVRRGRARPPETSGPGQAGAKNAEAQERVPEEIS
jgi:copper transport protein